MYYHPFYTTPYYGFGGFPYGGYGYGYGGYPYGGYSNYGTSINAIGSQIGSQSLINTGVATGISQVFTPTNIF